MSKQLKLIACDIGSSEADGPVEHAGLSALFQPRGVEVRLDYPAIHFVDRTIRENGLSGERHAETVTSWHAVHIGTCSDLQALTYLVSDRGES